MVVINTGKGVHYHPQGTDPGKKKAFTCMRLPTTKKRLADHALLHMLCKLTYEGDAKHTDELMYEVVLPHLAGCSLRQACNAKGGANHDPFAKRAVSAQPLSPLDSPP